MGMERLTGNWTQSRWLHLLFVSVFYQWICLSLFPFIGVIAYAGTIIDERKDGYCYQIIQKEGFIPITESFCRKWAAWGLLAVAILISLYLLTDIGIGQNPLWKDAIQVYLTPEFGSENETVYFGIHILTKSAGHVELVLLGMVSFFLTGCLFGLLGAIIAFVSDARVLVYAMPMIIMETGCGDFMQFPCCLEEILLPQMCWHIL